MAYSIWINSEFVPGLRFTANEDAENRSIDSKEEVSREMCSMLVDKAQNWQKTIAHVAKDLPGDLDNLNPLVLNRSYTIV